jgi:hypothetical protein
MIWSKQVCAHTTGHIPALIKMSFGPSIPNRATAAGYRCATKQLK